MTKINNCDIIIYNLKKDGKKIIKKCVHCGKEFEAKSNKAKYCSTRCCASESYKSKQTIINVVCKHCGKHFETTRGNKEFCSKECHQAYVKETTNKGEKHHHCLNCGKMFMSNSGVKKFCDTNCRSIYESKMKFKDSSTDDFVVCRECGFLGGNIILHIKTAHKMTQEEYMKKHNCDMGGLLSINVRKNISESQKECVKKGIGHRFTSENNPSHNKECREGRNSPYSMNFRGYDGKTDEEKQIIIETLKKNMANGKKENGNNPLSIDYYIKRGYSEDESKELLRDRQATFSLEKCIEKHGEDEGRRRWKERQEKWIRNYKHLNYSKVSQELFWKLYDDENIKTKDVYFATLNKDTNEKDDSGLNYEYMLDLGDSYVKPDFCIPSEMKAIEFNGAYWHTFSQEILERDDVRLNKMKEKGYSIYIVDELDYKENPEKVINECLNFLNT